MSPPLAMKLGQNTQRNSVPSREKEFEVLVVISSPGSARLTGVCSARLTQSPGMKQHYYDTSLSPNFKFQAIDQDTLHWELKTWDLTLELSV